MKTWIESSLQWLKDSPVKPWKILTFIGGLLVIMIILGISHFGTPRHRVLFNQLNLADAQQIITHLEAENIPYTLAQQGQEIRIAENLVEKTRLKLSAKGLQFSGTVGFELFDKNDFGMTDFSQKINFQRALQGELERTINSLDEVQQSRVHLVLPEHRFFQNINEKPKASVTLHLRSTLHQKQIMSIQQLIHASVPNLDMQEIVLVDSQGNILTPSIEYPQTRWFSQKKALEKYLSEKITHLLQGLFDSDQVIVRLDLTFNQDEHEQESIKPGAPIMTHEKEIHHSTTAKIEKSTTNEDITREKNYQSGTIKEHIVHASGTIKRLTISVLIPEKTSQKKLAKIRNLVKSAAGFDEKRGDSIQVEALIPEKIALPITPVISSPPVIPNPSDNFLTSIARPQWIAVLLALFVLAFRQHHIRKKRKQLLQNLTTWLTQS